MQFGVSVPNFGVHASRNALVDVAQAADELGYDSIWVAERLIVPEPPNQPWSKQDPKAYEPLVTLSFLSAITKNVKLGTGIVIAPFRSPIVLARQAAALDKLCEGRLILGLGLGWMAEEFRAAGVPMKERGRRTDEVIRLLRELWENSSPSFRGEFTEFPQIHFEPKPTQQRIPIWIGGNSDAALRRVIEHGDGWLPMGLNIDQLNERIEFIKQEANRRQRPIQDITLSHGVPFGGTKDISRTTRDLQKYQNMGIRHIRPTFNHERVDERIEQMKVFAKEVIPLHA